jgi:hypothetical protein
MRVLFNVLHDLVDLIAAAAVCLFVFLICLAMA